MNLNPTITASTSYPAQNIISAILEIIQHRKIIALCVLFSIILHVFFLFRLIGSETDHKTNTPISHSVDITLNKYIPEEAPKIQHTDIPVRKSVIHKPITAESKHVIPVEKQPVREEKIPAELVQQQIAQNQTNIAIKQPALLIREKKQYLKIIAAHLEKHKFYPRSARRRHIEGDVNVSFSLLSDGRILNLYVLSGHQILKKATHDSIQSALPLPSRPENLLALNTIQIEYNMQYTLQK